MCNLDFILRPQKYFEHLCPTKMNTTSIAVFSEGHEAHEKLILKALKYIFFYSASKPHRS